MKSWAEQVIPRLAPALAVLTERVAGVVAKNVVDVMRSSSPTGHEDDDGYRSSIPEARALVAQVSP